VEEGEEELAIVPSLLSQAVKKKEGKSTGRWKASNSPMDGACMCVLFV
jgi:hypothetical protein